MRLEELINTRQESYLLTHGVIRECYLVSLVYIPQSLCFGLAVTVYIYILEELDAFLFCRKLD